MHHQVALLGGLSQRVTWRGASFTQKVATFVCLTSCAHRLAIFKDGETNGTASSHQIFCESRQTAIETLAKIQQKCNGQQVFKQQSLGGHSFLSCAIQGRSIICWRRPHGEASHLQKSSNSIRRFLGGDGICVWGLKRGGVERCQQILTKELGMRHIVAKFVPMILATA